MTKVHWMRGIVVPTAGILFLFICFVFLAACARATGACDEDKTIDAVTEAVYGNLKEQLAFIAGVAPGSELSEDEWKAIRLGTRVILSNVRQTGRKGGLFQCAADAEIITSGGNDRMALTYTSELDASGGVKVMIQER